MSIAIKLPVPSLTREIFYQELTSRNHHFISAELQRKLSQIQILIAGCGSTGGACIEALARVGVCHFRLADNGAYEISNLNRQHARLENIGQNKAAFHAGEIRSINPFAEVSFSEQGINADNVDEYVSKSDFVFDAIDVTSREGIQAKILLHQKCHEYKKPVLAGLDLGYLQWGRSYDYRDQNIQILDGAFDEAVQATHPIAAIFKLYPVEILPAHAIELVLDLCDERVSYASQIGCTSDALSAIVVPAVLRYLEYGELLPGWKFDTSIYRYSLADRVSWWLKGFELRKRLRERLKNL